MPRGKSNHTNEILAYALSHLEKERDDIQSKIDMIQRQLGARGPGRKAAKAAPAEAPAAAPKRVLSAGARRRIAAAQKRRWAEHRRQQKLKAKEG